MITDLAQMKLFLSVPAFAAGLSFFLFLYFTVCFFAERIKWKKHRTEVFHDVFPGNGTEISRYEKIIRNETMKYTWYYSVIETVAVLIMTAGALFHERITEKTGTPFFIPVCLISALTAVFCILMKKRWKSEACDNLISCITLYTGAVHDFHAGIRTMLSGSGINIPLKAVLAEIQNDNPGISGSDLILQAGRVLRSEKIISYSGQEKVQKKRMDSYEFDAYNSGFGIFSFGIILVLCLLINF